jgi:hypothetical protein
MLNPPRTKRVAKIIRATAIKISPTGLPFPALRWCKLSFGMADTFSKRGRVSLWRDLPGF